MASGAFVQKAGCLTTSQRAQERELRSTARQRIAVSITIDKRSVMGLPLSALECQR
jgi:hypothetical protein